MDPPEQALVEVGGLAAVRCRWTSTPGSRGRTSPTPAWPSTLQACTPGAGLRREGKGRGRGSRFSEGDPGRRCRSTPSAESSAAGRPLSASRAGYPVIVSGLAARNRWPPAGPRFVEMQTAGRWQSPAMPGHYARGQLAARGAVARVRYGRG